MWGEKKRFNYTTVVPNLGSLDKYEGPQGASDDALLHFFGELLSSVE